MTFGSLFAGIGGFDLGLERAGMTCSWQVEIDDYATKVLEKHWPNVRRRRDVREFPEEPIDDWRVDLICGGFPCQPVSIAGNQKGDLDERWLWGEFARILGVLQPRDAVMENVPGLLSVDAGRLFGRVLGDLAEIGYDAEWHCIPASSIGAKHRRDRVWIVAHADSHRKMVERQDCHYEERNSTTPIQERQNLKPWLDAASLDEGWSGFWRSEPILDRVVDGVPGGVDRRRCLGNSIVPQVAEMIGKTIVNLYSKL
jgi:DNA (cytosine-5)-methyltransferase 1